MAKKFSFIDWINSVAPKDPGKFAIWIINGSHHKYSTGHIQHIKNEEIAFRGTFEEVDKKWNEKYKHIKTISS